MNFKFEDELHKELTLEDIEYSKKFLEMLEQQYKVVLVPRAAFRVHNDGTVADDFDDYVDWNYTTKTVSSYKLPSIDNVLNYTISELVAELGKSKILYVLEYGFNMLKIKNPSDGSELKYPTIRLTV